MFLVSVGADRVRPPEFLDDHRLAVVGGADQQQVWHALLVRPRIQSFQPVQRLDRARVADPAVGANALDALVCRQDRKSTRLNSSHVAISYAVFCLKKKKEEYK